MEVKKIRPAIKEKAPYEDHLEVLKTKRPHLKYSDWFINQSYIPEPDDEEYNGFWEIEEDRCKYGFFMEGYYIHGFLYWHLNFWKTEVTKLNEYGETFETYENPTFRDNEWIIADGISRAKYFQKGLAIGGSRRLGKSVFISSYISYGSSLFSDTQNLFVGMSGDDIAVTTGKISKGLNDIPDYFQWMRVKEDWEKQVSLGIKDTKGKKSVFSEIFIRNLEAGGKKKQESIAGTKPSILVLEEALSEDSLVYDYSGSKQIKDVQVGDYIFDDSGLLTKVLDKVDVGISQLYNVTLKDGRVLKCTGDHVWTLYQNWSGLMVDKTINQLLTEGYYYEKFDKRYNKPHKSFIYFVPNTQPLQYPKKDLPIDPYYLGLWLGDGESFRPQSLCSIDNEIIDYCVNYANQLGLGYTIRKGEDWKHPNFRDITITKINGRLNPIKEEAKKLILVENKHIPDIYLHSSVEQRMELLRGLMDTDGSCDVKGGIEFSSSFPALAKDFEDLCRGLGISLRHKISKPTYTHKGKKLVGKDSHKFTLYTDKDVFKLPRKLAKQLHAPHKKQDLYRSKCSIISIEKAGSSQAYCLKVDNDSNLFLTDKYTVTHNCGKSPWLKGFKAAVPGFTSPEGWICSPIAIFTGGDMDNYHDAKNVMMNPFSHNFLEYDCTENKRDRHGKLRKHGLFLGNKYRYDAKDLTTLGDYLQIEDPQSDFYNIPFYVSNEEKSLEILEDELERLLTNPDKSLYDKHRMYYPITVDDIFLNVGLNMYNTKACQKQQQAIEDAGITGIPVELYSDGTKICWRDSNKEYIKEFPVDRQSKDAPIMIYEFPEPGAPKFLYTFGVDSYTQDEAGTSDSLGTVYIYKRMHSLTGEGLRDAFVASYAARPDTQAEWDENARMLIMFYNAYGLVENDQPGFCKYMVSKGNAELYLSPTPSFYKTLVINGSTASRPYGVSRSSKAVREYLNVLLKKYMEETIHTVYDESGQAIIGEVKGVTRILDYTLLSELIGFGPGVNVDRQVAASLALACAMELDPMLGTKIGEDSKREQQTIDKAFNNIKKKTFKSAGSSFSGGRKLFKR